MFYGSVNNSKISSTNSRKVKKKLVFPSIYAKLCFFFFLIEYFIGFPPFICYLAVYTLLEIKITIVWGLKFTCMKLLISDIKISKLKLLLVKTVSITLQFSSVAQSCLTLCNPMDCSTPGFPVHHQLLELTQTHVHPIISSSVVPFSSCLQYFPASGSFQMSQLFASGWPWIIHLIEFLFS